jgi:immunoglobulin I-set domain protein
MNNKLALGFACVLTFVACGGSGGGSGQGNSTTPPPPTTQQAPTITQQPADQTVNVGAVATFTVSASGTAPLSYQWQKNGSAISGATSQSFTTPALTGADSGEKFSVVVSNSAGTVTSAAATLIVNAVTPSGPTITTQPVAQSAMAGSSATFKVVASGASPSYQWRRNGAAITGATAASYTIPAVVTSDDAAMFSVVVTDSSGSVTSSAAKLTVTPVTPANGIDVVTYKYDTSRTGQNINESILTTSNVNPSTFGLLRFVTTDGKVDAQPLYLSQLQINGAPRNVLFIATEHGSVYAIDTATYAQLWKVSLIPAGQSPSDDLGCDQVSPEIGITSTPVIDRRAGAHGVMYVVSMSKDSSNYHQILHALDVTTGADAIPPREITATFTDSTGAVTTFAPGRYEERVALLLSNGTIYTAWSSHCDVPPYGGWIITYDQATLAQNGVLNVGPSSAVGTGDTSATVGPGIWMSGGGPAVDAAGRVYLLTGNGPFDSTLNAEGRPVNGNYGQSFLKLRSDGHTLSIEDFFTLFNAEASSEIDNDLGAGGGLLLPQMTDSNNEPVNLYIGAGKDGNGYIVDQTRLGGFNPTKNNIYQQVKLNGTSGMRGTPAYFNNRIYFGLRAVGLKSFTFSQARMSSTASSITATVFQYPGTSPTVSANGTSNGIVWAHERNTSGAILHAYDATNLANELYNSAQASGGRDSFGSANKFIVPVVTGGKVFVASNTGVALFGLLN